MAERCQPLEELNSLSHAYYLWLSDIRGVVSRPVARSLAIVSVWKTGVRVYQNCWLYTLDRRRRERAIPLCISKVCHYVASGSNDRSDFLNGDIL